MKERRLSSIDHITFCILYVLYGKRVPTSWSSARHEPFTRFKTPQTLPRNLTWHAFTPLSIFQWLSDLSRADWLRAMVDESFYKCLKHSPATSYSTWILNIFASFLWSIRVQSMENCCLFVKLTLLSLLSELLQSVDAWSVIQDPYFQRVLTTIIPFFFHLQLTERVFTTVLLLLLFIFFFCFVFNVLKCSCELWHMLGAFISCHYVWF